jgi:hypothetical protein
MLGAGNSLECDNARVDVSNNADWEGRQTRRDIDRGERRLERTIDLEMAMIVQLWLFYAKALSTSARTKHQASTRNTRGARNRRHPEERLASTHERQQSRHRPMNRSEPTV